MPQNIYDNDAFYDAYSRFPRSQQGLAGAPEWPTVRTLVPNLEGARVLDLGCGFGAFDRWAIEQGAEQVIGIDLSANMLARAGELSQSSAIEYRRGNLAELEMDERDFDLIYSALAWHYIEDFESLAGRMRTLLAEGGHLIATVEHPIMSAPRVDQWQTAADGQPYWPLDSYLLEGQRTRHWLTDGVVKYHRSVGTYVNTLVDHGFRPLRVIEWGPDAEQIAEHPEWARETERPLFLILAACAV